LWGVTESLPPKDPRDALIREQAAPLEGQAADRRCACRST
jgi:hypothetical protein